MCSFFPFHPFQKVSGVKHKYLFICLVFLYFAFFRCEMWQRWALKMFWQTSRLSKLARWRMDSVLRLRTMEGRQLLYVEMIWCFFLLLCARLSYYSFVHETFVRLVKILPFQILLFCHLGGSFSLSFNPSNPCMWCHSLTALHLYS